MRTLNEFFENKKSTLEYHESLNPKLWVGEKLKPQVRQKLLEIANFWAENALIPDEAIEDILLTGGNANFNYTEFSDIDLHLLVDKSKIADCEDKILDEYLKDKKAIWGLTHDLQIYGISVEIYAQDISEKTSKDQGVFSVKANKWLQKPSYKRIDLKNPIIQKKAKYIEDVINYFIKNKVDNIQMLNKFKEKVRNMRGASIKRGGEFSVENLAFKEVRNKGLLDKFTNYIVSVEDKKLSLGDI
jgi:hypothetical protein